MSFGSVGLWETDGLFSGLGPRRHSPLPPIRNACGVLCAWCGSVLTDPLSLYKRAFPGALQDLSGLRFPWYNTQGNW